MAGENIKNEVLYRVYAVLVLLVVFALAIIYQSGYIVFVEGPEWRAQKREAYIRKDTIEAQRGNIYAADKKLLATSLPLFEIRMDLVTIDEKLFAENLDSLALLLATHVDKVFTPGGMKEYLLQKRADKERYLLIKKRVDYNEKKFISQFPIFREGRFRGGFIAEPTHNRVYPFEGIARRTLGYSKDKNNKVGIEGYFDEHLRGELGGRLVFNHNEAWIPLSDFSNIEPRKGGDVITTIDVDIQDITHQALYEALNYHDAEFGVAVVMEVATGAIRAMSNIGRYESGWYESYNHSIGSALEPGSTFKLAAVMALLEDTKIGLYDTIPLFQGKRKFYEEEMSDAIYHTLDSATLEKAFAISSNVGIASLIDTTYKKKGQAHKFINRLKSFNLHLPTGIMLEGEAAPFVKEAYSKKDGWSGVTLPWMSTGYEVAITPLQLLTFYNAVANNGRMMKPYLVSELRKDDRTLKVFRPTVVKNQIASESTIQKAQHLLRQVVDYEFGTANKFKTDAYNFAGKTGTAQINYRRGRRKNQLTYRASFAGYFPAEQPKYSVIVVVSKPRRGGKYGGEVAGPIFRRIADQVYESHVVLDQPFNNGPAKRFTKKQLPKKRAGYRADFDYLLPYFGLPYQQYTSNEWAVVRPLIDTPMVEVVKRTIKKDVVPSVVGMGLRDAIYILENQGLRVHANGYGRVVQQSILPNTKARGQTIRLYLN